MREARAFWVTAPGRGQIRTQQLRSPKPGELLIRTARERDQPGHAKASFSAARCRRASGSGCAVRSRRVIFQLRSNTAIRRSALSRTARRRLSVAACSASIRIRTGSSCRAMRSSMFRRRSRIGVRRSPPTWKRRSTGCGTRAGPGRPDRSHRRRRRRLPRRRARGAATRRGGRADRYRSGPRSDRRGARLPFCRPRSRHRPKPISSSMRAGHPRGLRQR